MYILTVIVTSTVNSYTINNFDNVFYRPVAKELAVNEQNPVK